MPPTKFQTARVVLQMRSPLRRRLGRLPVRRRVQGVTMTLPYSHLLPTYARVIPGYGQNLVALAAGLAAEQRAPLRMLDVGANIGDSTLQVLRTVPTALALCVEGDPYWAGYLRRNVAGDPRVEVEEALLTAGRGSWDSSTPVRTNGTTRFVQTEEGRGSRPPLPVAELRARHPEFAELRLVKSDTDGFDPVLVPAVAEAWRGSRPVLFFEFDPALARAADPGDPSQVWARLLSLGYTRLAVWDNLGGALGQVDTVAARAAAAVLEPPLPGELGYLYWDVAACHQDDSSGRAVLDRLCPGELEPSRGSAAAR